MADQGGMEIALLESTVTLLSIVKDNNISESRDLMMRLADHGTIRDICMADINIKQRWLKSIPKDSKNYKLHHYMASKGEVPLLEVIRKQRDTILLHMVENGLDVNDLDTQQNGWLMTPLEAAVRFMNFKAAVVLLKSGADPNKQNCVLQTPLAAAIQLSQNEFVKLFLGATKGKEVTEEHEYGRSPFLTLHLLSRSHQNEDTQILQLLLQYGADINAKDEQTGMYSLHLAILFYSGSVTIKIIQLLLRNKVNPNLKTPDGRTALHLACSPTASTYATKQVSVRKRCQLVSLLIQFGADRKLVDRNYNTPLHIAVKHDLPKVSELLLEDHHQLLSRRNIQGLKPGDLASPTSSVVKVLEEVAGSLSDLHSTASNSNMSASVPAISSQCSCCNKQLHSELQEVVVQLNTKVKVLEDSINHHLKQCSSEKNNNSPIDLSDVNYELQKLKLISLTMQPDDSIVAINRHRRQVSYTSMSSLYPSMSKDRLFYKACRIVSSSVGYDWKSLFREVDLNDPSQTEIIIQELESKYPGQLREQAYQALLRWKASRGRQASVEYLKMGLKECCLEGTLQILEEKLLNQM